jgi:hypothetical protein
MLYGINTLYMSTSTEDGVVLLIGGDAYDEIGYAFGFFVNYDDTEVIVNC